MSLCDKHRLWLAVRLAPEMTRSRFYALIERYGTPEAILGAPAREIAALRGFDNTSARAVLEAPRTASVAREAELIGRHGVRLLTPADPGYPENFRLSTAPPPLLYVRGTLEPEDRYALALVGSRNSTTYGRAVSQSFAARLATCGMTVISGFARGVDAAAHQGALAARGRTIAVLGNGLAVCYPGEHRALGERIVSGSGALLSEYPMEMPPERYNFPERNRLIATLSLGTIVVEAAERSGALITAREALEENRFVFAVPGDVTRLNSHGANALIQSGARLVQRADDALAEMKEVLRGYLREEMLEDSGSAFQGASARPASSSPPAQAAEGPGAPEIPTVLPPETSGSVSGGARLAAAPSFLLSPEESQVYELIRHEPQYLDSLADQLDPATFPVSHLSAVLLSLELKRAVRQLPGKLYAVLE